MYVIIYVVSVHNEQNSADCNFVLGVEVWANAHKVLYGKPERERDHMQDLGSGLEVMGLYILK
jgi:hypothetical protein